MIDPISRVAINVHSAKGVYALLLGSGLSSASGIPTGYGITRDLISQVAKLDNEQPEDLEEWYQKKYGREARYDELLSSLATTSPQRNLTLQKYFKPTEEEREQGLKLPTLAHKAIGKLVAKGYIKVIVTTNFDHLLEDSIQEAGVTPSVISTEDHTKGALPLVHSQCTIVKVNGDYLDTRIRNTEDELKAYEPGLNNLLDEIFDNYGLIVSGWSAEWDIALGAALERRAYRRFPTFWTHRGLTEHAERLISAMGGISLNIESAESFFDQLGEKVLALEDHATNHPQTVSLAVAQLKRYLPDPVQKIRYQDMLVDEATRVRKLLETERFSLSAIYTPEELAARARALQSGTSILLHLIATASYWAEDRHIDTIQLVIHRLGNGFQSPNGTTVWLDMQLYPAMLAFYCGGTAAVANRKGKLLGRLLSTQIKHPSLQDFTRPAAELLTSKWVIENSLAQKLPGMERHYTALSDWLFESLREILEPVTGTTDYDQVFDRFEYICALVATKTDPYPTLGRFAWKYKRQRAPRDLLDQPTVSLLLETEIIRDETEINEMADAVDNGIKATGWH